jgi:alpha-beta hydrolase superfamily lysophospholipase
MTPEIHGRLVAATWRCAVILFSMTAAFTTGCAPRVVPMGARLAEPEVRNHRFLTRDGLELPVRIWLPEGEPKAIMLALHGFNDYSNAFVEPANYWRRSGIATFAFDQRGFGGAPNRGYWPGISAFTDDCADMARLLHRRYPDAPIYLLGDSMGGAVATVAMAEDNTLPVAGMILVAPAVWARDTMNPFQSGLLWVTAHSVPWMTVTGRGLNIMPSDNIAMLRALGRDPLVIKETRIDTIYGLADLMDAAMESADKIKIPTLVLYGDHDEIVPREPTVQFIRRLEAADTRMRAVFYPKGYHLLLRDLSADVVMKDVRVWLANDGGPLPSGGETRAAQALVTP